MPRETQSSSLPQIRMVRVSELKTNPENPRKISHVKLQQLKISLMEDPEFLHYIPFLIDDEGIVWDGNQKLKVVKELSYEEVPTINISELSPEKKKRLMYKKNHHVGEDDDEMLYALFSEDELLRMGHESKKSAFEFEMNAVDEDATEYPLVPVFDEKYGCVVICYKTENEKAHLETMLNLEAMKAYNKNHIQTSYVMDFETFKTKWNER